MLGVVSVIYVIKFLWIRKQRIKYKKKLNIICNKYEKNTYSEQLKLLRQ